MNAQLAAFWFAPPGQAAGEQIEFHLRPLSQPQIIDIEEHRTPYGEVSRKGQWIAGTLGIIAVKGVTHPETGKPAAVPECFQWLNRSLIQVCGLRLLANEWGLDWDKLQAGEQPGTEPQDDPAKN